MKCVGVLAMFVCASVSSAQALVPLSPTMQQWGGYDFYLGANAVASGVSSAPSSLPTPGAYGPVTDSYSWQGANWSTGVSSVWSIAHTATTSNVSGQVMLTLGADATASATSVLNGSFAQISFAFTAAQPVSFTANWYSPVASPYFGTATYSVLGGFSPYPPVTMSSLTPMTNGGVLGAGIHIITLTVDLTVSSAAGGAVYDAAALGFDLHATVIPAPGGTAVLGLGAALAFRRRRRS